MSAPGEYHNSQRMFPFGMRERLSFTFRIERRRECLPLWSAHSHIYWILCTLRCGPPRANTLRNARPAETASEPALMLRIYFRREYFWPGVLRRNK
jgi:hypothetical protein